MLQNHNESIDMKTALGWRDVHGWFTLLLPPLFARSGIVRVLLVDCLFSELILKPSPLPVDDSVDTDYLPISVTLTVAKVTIFNLCLSSNPYERHTQDPLSDLP